MDWLTLILEWTKEALNSQWLTNVLLLLILFEIIAHINLVSNQLFEMAQDINRALERLFQK